MASRHIKEKQVAYAEGLRHGFGVAQDIIKDLTDGNLTLNEPEAIKSWTKREARLRDELSIAHGDEDG